ncbi:44155_t:CDS:2, partial [Gigaspora margarita]
TKNRAIQDSKLLLETLSLTTLAEFSDKKTNIRINGGSNFTVGASSAEVKIAGFGINFGKKLSLACRLLKKGDKWTLWKMLMPAEIK